MIGEAGSLEERVRRIEDESAILKRIYAYCTAIDEGREAEWLDCFTEDALLRFDVAPAAHVWQPQRPAQNKRLGHKELADLFRTAEQWRRAATSPPKHTTVNAIINIQGDEARAESRIVMFIDVDGKPALVSTGRYHDKLRRCADGQWRFYERLGDQDTLMPRAS